MEFATEDERRAAVLDLLETRREATMVDKFVNDGQKLNLDEFNSFLDKLAAKYEVEDVEVAVAQEPEPDLGMVGLLARHGHTLPSEDADEEAVPAKPAKRKTKDATQA